MATRVLEVHLVGDDISLSRSFAGAEKSAVKAATGIEASATRMVATGKKMQSAGRSWTRGLTLPVAALGAASIKLAVDFDKSMRNVNSIAGLPEKNLKQLERQVLGMAGRTAQAPKTLAEGLYDLVSSGFDAKDSMVVLEASANAATAGLTTTDVATKAVAASLNAYQQPAGKAGEVSDVLFETVNRGVVSFDALAGSIGYVLPAAATMGVNIKELGASIATLTKGGQSGDTAVTNINAAITAFIKPSKMMNSILKEMGYESGQQLIKQKGFQGALEAVTGAVKGNKQAIGELFGNVRAMRAVFGLTGANAKTAKEDVDALADSLGSTNKVLKEQEKSFSFQWNRFRAEVEETAIALGKKLLPVLKDIVNNVKTVIGWFDKLPNSTKAAIGKVVAVGATIGPALWIGGKLLSGWGKLILLVSKARNAIIGFRVAASAASGAAAVSGASAGAAAAASTAAVPAGYTAAKSGLLIPASAAQSAAASTGSGAGVVMAKSMVKSFATKFGPLIALAGLASIVISATQRDWHDVGWKAGGAVVGGIAGFMLGGPAGAALGAGIGSFAGDLGKRLWDGILGGGDDSQSAFQQRTQKVIKDSLGGRRAFVRSSKMVEDAEQRLARIGRRQADIQDRIRSATKRLNDARQGGNLGKIRREEARLNELKAKQIHLTHQQWRGESLLHTAKVKNEQDARRTRTVEVALIRTRQAQLEQSRKHERVSRRAFEQAVLQQKPLKEQNEREKDLIAAQKRRRAASEKLKGAEKELGGSMKEITNKFGKKFADQLREQIPLWRSTAGQIKAGKEAMRQLIPGVQTLSQRINSYKAKQKDAADATDKGTGKLRKFGGAAKEAGRKVQSAKTEVVGGFSGMEAKGTSFLGALNVPSPFTTAPKKAGGGLMQVAGRGLQDTVPMMQQDIAAMVAPGEMLAVINRHQAPLLSQAVSNEYGVNGLGGFFNTFNKPHYMAVGGLVEPKIQQGGAFRKGEQKEVNIGFKALTKYLQQHSEPKRVTNMLNFAISEGNKGYPYVYGGGHGSFSGPYDCSGYVSAILHAGNFLSTPMSTQQGSGLNTLGEGGDGKWFTWGVRGSSGMNAHTMISIKDMGKGWRFFESGSGHGAQEVGGWSGAFEHRHMPGFARGGIVDQTKIPRPAKEVVKKHGTDALNPKSPNFVGWGYNAGGIVPRFSTGGPVPPKDGTVVGASYYGGPTDGVSGTVGAAGVSLPGTSSFAELAMGQSLGGLDFHTKMKFSRSGKSVIAEKLDIGSGGDDVNGRNRAVDFWYETGAQLGIGPSSGVGLVRVEPAKGAATTKKEEVVPGVFHGAKTKSLSFPSVPKTLPAIKREINRWQKEAASYRKAIDLAKDKPKTQRALQANLTKIENHLRQLYDARSKVRFEKAKKKLHTKLAKQLGKLTGKEVSIEKAEKSYEEADQYASQVVDLEPQAPRPLEPTNPNDEVEVKRIEKQNEDAEKAYAETYKNYIDHKERMAYEKVLFVEADWRNKIIEAERFATGLEKHWETGARTSRVEIEGTNRFTDKVADYIRKVQNDIERWQRKHPKKGPKEYPDWLKSEIVKRDLMIDQRDRMRSKLPMLRERNRSFSAILGEGREHFYGGEQWIGSAKNFNPPNEPVYPGTGAPLNPPKPPISGSGTLEEALINVQGIHWPDQHSYIQTLPAKREAGRFGGVIWETQAAIEELGLKVAEVGTAGGGGGGSSESGTTAEDELATEKLALTEEMLSRERIRIAEMTTSAAVIAGLNGIGPRGLQATYPWAGRFAEGGIVTALVGEEGPELAAMPTGTNISSADKTEKLLRPRVEVNNYVNPDGTVDTDVLVNGEQMDAIVNYVSEQLGPRSYFRAQTAGNGNVGTLAR